MHIDEVTVNWKHQFSFTRHWVFITLLDQEILKLTRFWNLRSTCVIIWQISITLMVSFVHQNSRSLFLQYWLRVTALLTASVQNHSTSINIIQYSTNDNQCEQFPCSAIVSNKSGTKKIEPLPSPYVEIPPIYVPKDHYMYQNITVDAKHMTATKYMLRNA